MPHRSRELRWPSTEVERLTKAEAGIERLWEIHDELREDHEQVRDSHADKLSLHEKAILGICGVIYILAQDKFPALAAILKGLHP